MDSAPAVKKINQFDFFSLDFKEELSALNGDMIFAQVIHGMILGITHQAEYLNFCVDGILKLYKQNTKLTDVSRRCAHIY
jgi:hypothetical protein